MVDVILSNIRNKVNESNKDILSKEEIFRLISEVQMTVVLPAIESNGVKLTPETHEMECKGVKHNLPKREFDLLYYLISNKNKVINRNKIINDVWGNDVVVVDKTIDVHVCKIRSKLNVDNLQSIKSVGLIWRE